MAIRVMMEKTDTPENSDPLGPPDPQAPRDTLDLLDSKDSLYVNTKKKINEFQILYKTCLTG